MSFLKKNIISLEPKIFGMDLSDLSVKVFQLEKEGDEKVVRSFGTGDIPAGVIDDGRIVNKQRAAEIIREVVKKSGPKKINTKKVICSIPESKVFLRTISIPKMAEDEAGEAVKWEMEANIPLSIDQVYYDWQFIDSEIKNKQSVLTAAVSREIADGLIEALELAGLDVYGLEVESIASARSLASEKGEASGAVTFIVDIGEKRTSFIITVNGIPHFTSSIPFSSAGIDDAISKNLNLETREAEEAKKNQGIENSSESNPIFSAVKPLLENLIQDLKKTTSFYEEVLAENCKLVKACNIEKIFLCGGGANLKGLAPYMEKKLGKKVEVGNPWINFSIKGKTQNFGINKENSVRYATAIGLAMRGVSCND